MPGADSRDQEQAETTRRRARGNAIWKRCSARGDVARFLRKRIGCHPAFRRFRINRSRSGDFDHGQQEPHRPRKPGPGQGAGARLAAERYTALRLIAQRWANCFAVVYCGLGGGGVEASRFNRRFCFRLRKFGFYLHHVQSAPIRALYAGDRRNIAQAK